MSESTQLSQNEASIAELVRAGDTSAFSEVMDLYFNSAMQLAYRLLGSRDAAMDTAQWVFARIWEHRSRFLPTHSIKSYILGAARNRAMNELRHNKVRQQHEDVVDEETLAARNDSDTIEDRATLSALLAKLPERRREALEFRYLEQLSYAEVGKVLGISPGAAEQLVIRALEQLKQRQ